MSGTAKSRKRNANTARVAELPGTGLADMAQSGIDAMIAMQQRALEMLARCMAQAGAHSPIGALLELEVQSLGRLLELQKAMLAGAQAAALPLQFAWEMGALCRRMLQRTAAMQQAVLGQTAFPDVLVDAVRETVAAFIGLQDKALDVITGHNEAPPAAALGNMVRQGAELLLGANRLLLDLIAPAAGRSS